jgi:hypothetical protein
MSLVCLCSMRMDMGYTYERIGIRYKFNLYVRCKCAPMLQFGRSAFSTAVLSRVST